MAVFDFNQLLKVDRLGRESHIAHLAKMHGDGVLADRWTPVIAVAREGLSAEERETMYHWFEVWCAEKWGS